MEQDSFRLGGRRAVVCGATQGIGRAIALMLAGRGAAVTAVGRNEEALGQVVAELGRAGAAGGSGGAGVKEHRSVTVDFSDWKAVERAAQAEAARGAVHILVHNTGGPPAGFTIDAKPEEFLNAIQMHVLTAQVMAQALAPGMREAKYGRIVCITSTSVVTPIRGLGVSNTTRAAMANWCRSMAVELAPFGVTVNCVLPGFTKTARLAALFKGRAARAGSTPEEVEQDALKTIPAGRIGAPEEIAAVVAFLVSPAASYVNGVNLPVDGGRLVLQ